MKRLKWIAAGLVILAVGATKTVVWQDAATAAVKDLSPSTNVWLAAVCDDQIKLPAVKFGQNKAWTQNNKQRV